MVYVKEGWPVDRLGSWKRACTFPSGWRSHGVVMEGISNCNNRRGLSDALGIPCPPPPALGVSLSFCPELSPREHHPVGTSGAIHMRTQGYHNAEIARVRRIWRLTSVCLMLHLIHDCRELVRIAGSAGSSPRGGRVAFPPYLRRADRSPSRILVTCVGGHGAQMRYFIAAASSVDGLHATQI